MNVINGIGLSDPMLVKTDEFKAHFGNDYFVGVLTECDNIFTKKNLTLL